MDGRELAQALGHVIPGLKALFSSGYTASVISHHGILEKGVKFIGKPFSLQRLTGKIREVLDS
ncbi:MAG: hypothetical protein JXO49_00525 [Deltaproteobacteria bacterium]|nr:hypothetical protein [Candidatus Anaeroferrophillus wilburensis]MBN2887809.1 hypothetical protein [Deltaproteobacteria bacterium]